MSIFAGYPGRVYTSRDRVREYLRVDSESSMEAENSMIDRTILSVSETIERLTGRVFLPHIATYNFDYESSREVHFFRDLLSVTTLTDSQGVVTSDEYTLYPLDAPNLVPPQPHRWLEMNEIARSLSYETTHRAAIEIAGKWGYSEITRQYGKILSADINTLVTTLTLTKDINVSPGTILLLDDEQIFVNDADDVLSPVVTRAVNGTTAAAHTAANSEVYTLHAPSPIEEAVCALVSRSLARGRSGYSDLTGSQAEGANYFKSLPAEVSTIIKGYRDMELQNFRVSRKEFWWNVSTNLPR